MELIDRYLHAVRFWLPRAQQDDILAELSEDIHSQIEERERELDRKLDESEMAELLKRRGHPMLVAGRYLPQRPLIGPALLPTYFFVLKMVLLWILVPVFAVIVAPLRVAAAHSAMPQLFQTAWDLLMGMVFAFGLITLIFALIERYPAGVFDNWDPRKLPRVQNAAIGREMSIRCSQASELAGGLISAAGWIWAVRFHPTFDFGVATATLAPIWQTLFWPVLIVFLAGAATGYVSLIQPSWSRLRFMLRLAIHAAIFVMIWILFAAGEWVQIAGPNLTADSLAQAISWTNLGFRLGFVFMAFATLFDAFQELRRSPRREKNGPARYPLAS